MTSLFPNEIGRKGIELVVENLKGDTASFLSLNLTLLIIGTALALGENTHF